MRELDESDMDRFVTLDSSEKTIDVPGDRWRPQATKQEGGKISKTLYFALSAQPLEGSQLGVGTVLRLERDTWPMVK